MSVTYLKPLNVFLSCVELNPLKPTMSWHCLLPDLTSREPPSPVIRGVPATVTFSLCRDNPWVPPSPAVEFALLFLWQELSPGECLVGSVAHLTQFSAQMPSCERGPSSISSLKHPHMLTLHLSLLFHFLHSPYHYLKICT